MLCLQKWIHASQNQYKKLHETMLGGNTVESKLHGLAIHGRAIRVERKSRGQRYVEGLPEIVKFMPATEDLDVLPDHAENELLYRMTAWEGDQAAGITNEDLWESEVDKPMGLESQHRSGSMPEKRRR